MLQKKEFRIEIWIFSFQICFQNQFLTSGSGRTENTQICVFSVLPLPEVKKWFENRFEMRVSIFLFKKFFGAFWLVFKKVKRWISHCIFKKWCCSGRVNYGDRLWVLKSFWSIFGLWSFIGNLYLCIFVLCRPLLLKWPVSLFFFIVPRDLLICPLLVLRVSVWIFFSIFA